MIRNRSDSRGNEYCEKATFAELVLRYKPYMVLLEQEGHSTDELCYCKWLEKET